MATYLSTTPLAATLGAPPVAKLTSDNFLYWKAQVLPAFHGDRVMVLLEYYDLAPSGELEVEDDNKKKIGVPNPAYYT